MSKLLFRLDKKFTVVLDEDAMDLEPCLRLLNSKQKLFLVLGWDYFSPYARLTKEERIGRARRQTYGKEDVSPETDKKFINAIEAYMGLQYDYRRDFRDSNLDRAKELQHEMISEKDVSKIPKYQSAINVFLDNAKKYQAEIDALSIEEQDNLKGDSKLSFIEKWQNNQREYKKNKVAQQYQKPPDAV